MANWLLVIAAQIVVVAIVVSVALLLVGIGVLVVLHVCIVGRAFQRFFVTVSRGESPSCGSNGGGLSPNDLERLPCYDFGAGEKGISALDCAVCLESFQMGERCRLLPVCKHSFHARCVDSWLLITPICPICRTSADHRKAGGAAAADSPGLFSGGFR